jgi:hypothetical protein
MILAGNVIKVDMKSIGECLLGRRPSDHRNETSGSMKSSEFLE